MAEEHTSRTGRRTVLLTAWCGGLTALTAGCAARPDNGREPVRRTPGPVRPPPVAATPHCVLTTEWGSGPYYLDLGRLRSDITEGREGVPLRLDLTLVRVSAGCRPLAGATVDVWQADAQGAYSTGKETFLRGTQTTDSTGRCVFRTVLPGWYAGLAPHIHFKVRPDARSETSSQLFFPEDLLRDVYARQPYARRPGPEHPNSRDRRYRESGGALTLAPTPHGAGYRAVYTVGIA
ncbi:intradiol ring-cleavage dioxygenase [Streptomyces sp. CB00455]|uniref:dioxygenase family protein n=1 Tax=Streptomyces sp. CB00455 TaxID=1703927 RepID=UPI00093A739B|nr:intradiol ring-cleavage dioxygenase [Streptomyces sp. CB00455]OKK17244.1 intradiol ring-cleavage dioxygenase [Streptomyces sp. CB00455]